MTDGPSAAVVAGWSHDTHRLDEVAVALDTLIDRGDEAIVVVVRGSEAVADRWAGVAADAHRTALAERRADAARVAMAAGDVVAALRRRGPDLAYTAAAVDAFRRAVVADGYRVAVDGRVIPGPDRPADVPRDASPALAQSIATTNAAGHSETLRRLVEVARAADARLAADLDGAATGVTVHRLADAAGVELPIGPAASVARTWRAASVDQRMAWAAADPGLGNRAGIPAADRDRLNRMRLSAMRTTTAAHRALRRRLTQPDRFLLTLRDDGRAVVAVGDPDVARDVAVLVPGTGTTLASASTNLDRAERLRREAGGATSVVVWQDYAAPADLVAAADPAAARTAAVGLGAFASDLRATHIGAAAHQTVIGHSYGSTVVGVCASRSEGLDASDVVLVASPGAGGALSAADLHLTAAPTGDGVAHVWAGTADRDPIRLASPYVLGRDPTSPLFGARELPSSPGDPPWDAHSRFGLENHSGYWDTGSPTLAAMGAVIAGRADR